MEANDISNFLTACLTAPLGMPAAFILSYRRRPALKENIRPAALSVSLLIILIACARLLTGPERYLKLIAGFASFTLCCFIFICFSRLRGRRLLFTAATAALLAAYTESAACMLAARGSFFWLAVKTAATAMQCVILYLFCRRPFLEMLETGCGGWGRMSLLPLSLLASFITVCLYPAAIKKECVHYSAVIVLAALGVIIYIVLYFFLKTVRNQYMGGLDGAALRAQIQYLERQTERLRSVDKAIRVFRHDMRGYIGLLRDAFPTGGDSGASHILRGMEESLDKISGYNFLTNYTGNPMTDSVLSMYADQARDNWIEFEVSLELPEALKPNIIKITAIIANAVENAINACAEIPAGQRRAVRVMGSMRTEQFFLCVSNTYSGTVELDPESGLPADVNSVYGQGIQSIAAFAREYGAILHFYEEDGWFTFSILI